MKSANRRTAIKAITVMGGVGALGGRHALIDAADAAVAAYRKRARVDPMTLEELDQDVERFALECLGVPHAELFLQVCDDWQQVERFLDARQRLKDRAHLTLLGGQLTYFLARLSFNMGDYAAARRHAVLAWQYAEDVEQPVLCASVRTLQGTIAFYAGQHEKALDLLRAARAYDTPYNRSRIAANMARAYAVLGDRSRAEQALAAMERHLVDLPPQPGDSPYTTATAMSALATTLACLGEGEAAEPYARRAVALHYAPGVRDTLFEDRGNATLNLAASLVSGDSRNRRKQLGSASRRSPSPRSSGPKPSASGQWSCIGFSAPGGRSRRSRASRIGSAGMSCQDPTPDQAPEHRPRNEGCHYRCDCSTASGRTSPVAVSRMPALLIWAVTIGWS